MAPRRTQASREGPTVPRVRSHRPRCRRPPSGPARVAAVTSLAASTGQQLVIELADLRQAWWEAGGTRSGPTGPDRILSLSLEHPLRATSGHSPRATTPRSAKTSRAAVDRLRV